MEQELLFGREESRCDASFARVERVALADGAWLELQRGWLAGHVRVYEHLRDTTAWRSEDRKMYDRVVEVPRLIAVLQPPRAPIIEEMRAALNARYATDFTRVSLAYYRDGRDSVAWHGDYVARELSGDTLVATVSVGSARKFLVRPRGGGRSLSFNLGHGDLIVMGGSCQRTHQHAIPKVAHADPRIAIMFRPVWE